MANDKTSYFRVSRSQRSEFASQKGIPRPHTFNRKPDEETLGRGVRLVNLLWNRMAQKGMTPEQLAAELEVSHTYVLQLHKGEKDLADLPHKLLRKMAEFLDLPPAQVYVLADTLGPKDFHDNGTLEQRLDRAHERMSKDPVWCGWVPSESQWAALPQDTKVLITLLFERVAQTRFLDKTVAPNLAASEQKSKASA